MSHHEEVENEKRLIVVAEYGFPEYAKTDFHDLKKNEDVNKFVEFNAVYVGKKEDGEPDLDYFEASTVRGAAVGLAAGAMLGAIFPPAALGIIAGGAAVGLFGAATGGLIAHARHGEHDKPFKDLAEALPIGKAAVVVSTLDLDAGDRIQAALAGAETFYTHVWEGDVDLAEVISADAATGTEIGDGAAVVESLADVEAVDEAVEESAEGSAV